MENENIKQKNVKKKNIDCQHCDQKFSSDFQLNRGVSGYLKLGGQVVMWRAAAATPTLGGAFYSAKNLVGNCPLATYAPVSF